MKKKKSRKYGIIYKELPFGGIGKETLFSKSRSTILEDFKQYKHIEIMNVVFLGWYVNPS
ncbi:MAG: hypothetical protein J6T10_22560 [Methanobrevibacter sp.]|nr:hypothetical protein [Methanobrevibacter sp.]